MSDLGGGWTLEEAAGNSSAGWTIDPPSQPQPQPQPHPADIVATPETPRMPLFAGPGKHPQPVPPAPPAAPPQQPDTGWTMSQGTATVSTEPPHSGTAGPGKHLLTAFDKPPATPQPVVPHPELQAAAPQALGTPASPPTHALEVAHSTITPKLPMGPPASAQVNVVVSLPDKRVIVQDAAGKVLREYHAFVGTKSSPTPEGQFRIIEDLKPDPKGSEWYYGGHFMSFLREPDRSQPGYTADYGFHGWVYDKSDDAAERAEPGWKTTTHGCVQLDNRDLADFASLVRAGDRVTILNKSMKR